MLARLQASSRGLSNGNSFVKMSTGLLAANLVSAVPGLRYLIKMVDGVAIRGYVDGPEKPAQICA